MAIYCMPDHTHVLIGGKPDMNLATVVKEIKSASSLMINQEKWFPGKFYWQEGYGAFTYSHRQVPIIINYILNQEAHHRAKKLREEYLELLKEHQVEFQEQYLFEWMG